MENKICCFTGHRPEKLNETEQQVKELLEKAIKDSVKEGFLTFITGMARGVDIWAAEIVLKLKEQNQNIRLICAMPYKGFEKKWKLYDIDIYNKIIEGSDEKVFVCQHYSSGCYQMRNCYMVDRSNKVIAVFNGKKGGTKNTIYYANRQGVDVINVLE